MTLQAQLKWVTNIADFRREVEAESVQAHSKKVDALCDRIRRELKNPGGLGN